LFPRISLGSLTPFSPFFSCWELVRRRPAGNPHGSCGPTLIFLFFFFSFPPSFLTRTFSSLARKGDDFFASFFSIRTHEIWSLFSFFSSPPFHESGSQGETPVSPLLFLSPRTRRLRGKPCPNNLFVGRTTTHAAAPRTFFFPFPPTPSKKIPLFPLFFLREQPKLSLQSQEVPFFLTFFSRQANGCASLIARTGKSSHRIKASPFFFSFSELELFQSFFFSPFRCWVGSSSTFQLITPLPLPQ